MMNKIIEHAEPIKVALLGHGVVGSQVARLLTTNSEALAARVGHNVELVGIAVRSDSECTSPICTTDAMALINRGDLDIVVELIGGIHPALEFVMTAIQNGASVVTANKALLAAHGKEIFAAAQDAGVDVYYEAAVAGAVPIVRPLRESLVGDEILSVMGIVNGTTNYIIDKMTRENVDFATALAEAQALGYAEADPTADVEGHDAQNKVAILAGLAFHTNVELSDVYCEGITQITPEDIAAADEVDCVVKLLAITKLTETGEVEVRVHPAMVPKSHPLASVAGAYNAIFVEAKEAGRLMFFGAGAGGAPTASAVVGDIVTVARNRARGVSGPVRTTYAQHAVAPMGETRTSYHLRFKVADRPGILAAAAAILAAHNVSIQNVTQSASESREGGWSAQIGLLTHEAREADVQECLAELRKTDFISGDVKLMRVEGK